MKLTTLDALMLFLVSHKGQSGYDIRQLFQSTPLGLFSDSPGAIYPALARLEMRELLSSTAEPDGRRRRVYERTAEGEAALKGWLAAPIDPDAIVRRPQDLDLRYVITAEMLGRPAAMAFIRDYAAVQKARHEAVVAFRDTAGQHMGRASLDALELGVRLGATRLRWFEDLLAEDGGLADEDDQTRRSGA
ncbi:MAG: PadR family transcriptional regulator [Proteobacteria bacterium]|nr:PadR family transcriptional regulator [Pseudomonadota bacterium]